MYRVGAKLRTKRRRWPIIVWLITAITVVAIGGLLLARRFHTAAHITQAPAVIKKVTSLATDTKVFSEPGFDLKLPTDWKLQSHITGEYTIYRFQGTGKLSVGQQLDVYQDTIPVNFPVNRVQTVEASGSHMNVVGSVSDNCADFTKASPSPGQAGTPAKWQTVDFLCDLHNTTRNVVGTSTAGGINRVTLQGAAGGNHNFFIAYTDNGLTPDYEAFYGAIASFSAH